MSILAEVYTDAVRALVHELVPGASPLGVYAMGAVTVMAAQAGLVPDRQLLYAASRAAGLMAIDVVFKAWSRAKGVQLAG